MSFIDMEKLRPDIYLTDEQCESCDKYANLRRAGFCVGCTWTLLTNGTHLRSGWMPKQQLTITSLPRINMNKENPQ